MLDTTSLARLGDELPVSIGSYLAKSASNSLSKVQHLCGIDFKTLKKIITKDANLKNINPLKLAKLANLVGEKRSLMTFFKKYRHELDSKQVDFYLSLYSEKVENQNAQKLEPLEFEVFTICANLSGASITQVQELGGLRAVVALEKLIEQNLVQVKEHRYVASEKGFQFYERDHLKNHITDFSKKIKLNRASNLKNYLMFAHQSLNQKGVEMLEELTCRYHQDVLKIFGDRMYQGQNHYYIFLGYDANIDKDYTSKDFQGGKV